MSMDNHIVIGSPDIVVLAIYKWEKQNRCIKMNFEYYYVSSFLFFFKRTIMQEFRYEQSKKRRQKNNSGNYNVLSIA